MKSYYRLMLGQKSAFAEQCFKENFIGVNFGINEDLTPNLTEVWRDFNNRYVPIYLKNHPDKNRITAGISCGFLITVAKAMKNGDIVLCPDGSNTYHLGEISGDYYYQPGTDLPHRRPVKWLDKTISRSTMSIELKRSTGSIGTVCDITKYSPELETLIGKIPVLLTNDPTIEDPLNFGMESHLEDFLIENWEQTDLGKDFNVFEDGIGQQFKTDAGIIDILAVSKDKTQLLVIELKKGRASDVVVGQILRYMGYVKEELAEDNQTVKGVIIALDDDERIRLALKMVNNIEFYRYQVSFKLVKASAGS